MKNVTIYPIVTGYAKCDKGTYLYMKGEAGVMQEIPVICFYIEGLDKKILVDTGLPDVERANRYHHPTERKDGKQVHEALKEMNLSPEDIDIIIFTHLHWDHCSNMKLFKNARYIAHKKELKFALDPLPPYYRSYESKVWGIEAPFIGENIETVTGETEIVSGLSVFPTTGHSPGSMSIIVEAKTGTYVLPGDAIFIYDNVRPNPKEHWKFWVPQRYVNIIELWNSMEDIMTRVKDDSYILPSHEMKVLDKKYYE